MDNHKKYTKFATQNISLVDIFGLEKLQYLQDSFSNAHGVASVITDKNGQPITKPSNFTRFCKDIIRSTEKGRLNCYHSDAVIGRNNSDGPIVQPCLSSGLWDAGVPIIVGGKYVANWLIGQVRTEKTEKEKIKNYAKEIGADLTDFNNAYNEVPVMSSDKFKKIADLLLVFANQLSEVAYNNMQLNNKIQENAQINALLLQREEKIKEERILLRTIIDSIPDAIYVKDSKFRKVIANKMDCYNCGVEKEEDIIGKSDDEIFTPKIAKDLLADDYSVVKKKIPIIDREEYIKAGNNEGKYISTSKLPLYDNKGKVIGLVGIGHDITKQKKAADLLKKKNIQIAQQNEVLKQTNIQLKKAKEKAEESDRFKTAFLANMSHEIRTPMNGILGFAELLKETDLKNENRIEYLDIIEKSGMRMLNIINNIIDISKLEAGLMNLNIEETNLNEQIKFIYNFFKCEAETKNIALLIETPMTDHQVLIKTDKEKVYAVLTNLVKNAIKFTKNASIKVGYESFDVEKSSFIKFYVKDYGIGIPKNRHKAIFDRFIQVDLENKNAVEGTGLGLAITKSYIELMGGEIWVESQLGKGSTFYFTLPNLQQS